MLVNVFNGSWNGGYLVVGGRNLILNGKGDTKSGFFKKFNTVTDEYAELTLKSKKQYATVSLIGGFLLGERDYIVGETYIWSYDIMYTAWSFPTGSNHDEFWMGQRYTCDPSGQHSTGDWVKVTAHDLPIVGSDGCELNKWYHVNKVITIPVQASANVGSQQCINFYNSNADVEASFTARIKNVKLEKGNIATDWTPAPEDTFEEGTKHPKSIFTNTIPVKKKYQYTYGFLNQNSIPTHTIRFMKPDGTWVKAVHVNEDATSGMKSLEIDDDYNIEIMFQNGLTDAQKASFKIMEENFMAIKASNQVSVIDITDGYSVILTNDSYTFLGDTDSVSTTQSTTSQIVAMCGSEIVSCTMGEVTCPNGLSVVSDNKTPSPTLTITATSALTKAGTIDIPIKIGDITIVKKFSFAIAFTGAKGDKGDKGTGVTIKSKAIEYLAGSSGTTAPTGTWQSTIPTVPQGQYLWTRTTVTYSDGNQTVSYSAARQGVNGTSPTVSSSKVQYQQSTSGTTVPTGTWVDTPPAAVAGQYMWSKTTATYSDGKTAVSYNVTRNGSNGAKGDKGDKGAAGADALALVITSSAGVIFKNTSIATTLTAHVYKGGIEMTGSALTALGTIKWYKDGGTTAIATGQTYTISAGDVENKANFTAQLEG